ncbi:MAG: hypothetical protein HZC28_08720 [Spirochaetes bacterium]|nr:hypothetical protein [Spirochaetota bacterium]
MSLRRAFVSGQNIVPWKGKTYKDRKSEAVTCHAAAHEDELPALCNAPRK